MTARSKRSGATCASMTAPIRSDTGAPRANPMTPSFKQAAAAARPGAAGAAPSLEQGSAHEIPVLAPEIPVLAPEALLTDSHCHVQASSEQELQTCLHSYRASAVAHFNLYSTTLANAQRVAAALRALPPEAQARFSLGLGLHPWFLKSATFERELMGLIALYDELKREQPTLLGPCWGEVGLDNKHSFCLPLLEQQALLREFIVATKERCPCYSFHCVGAQSELLALLKAQQVTGIVHGFSGKVAAALQLVARGLKLGLGPNVLRPEQEHKWRALLSAPELALSWCLESDWDGGPYEGTLLARIAQRVDSLKAAR